MLVLALSVNKIDSVNRTFVFAVSSIVPSTPSVSEIFFVTCLIMESENPKVSEGVTILVPHTSDVNSSDSEITTGVFFVIFGESVRVSDSDRFLLMLLLIDTESMGSPLNFTVENVLPP